MNAPKARGKLGLVGLAGLLLTAAALVTAFIAVLLQFWTVAAASALLSMGFFMAYTTLALSVIGRRARNAAGSSATAGGTAKASSSAAGKLSVEEMRELRALRTAVESAEARTAAAERRLISTLEAQRAELSAGQTSYPDRSGPSAAS